MNILVNNITDIIVAEVNAISDKVKGLNFLEKLKVNIITKVMEINQAKIIFSHMFYNKKRSIAKILVKICSIKKSGKVARMPKALYNKIISKG